MFAPCNLRVIKWGLERLGWVVSGLFLKGHRRSLTKNAGHTRSCMGQETFFLLKKIPSILRSPSTFVITHHLPATQLNKASHGPLEGKLVYQEDNCDDFSFHLFFLIGRKMRTHEMRQQHASLRQRATPLPVPTQARCKMTKNRRRFKVSPFEKLGKKLDLANLLLAVCRFYFFPLSDPPSPSRHCPAHTSPPRAQKGRKDNFFSYLLILVYQASRKTKEKGRLLLSIPPPCVAAVCVRNVRHIRSRKRFPSSSSCVSEFFLVRSKPHLFFFLSGKSRSGVVSWT